MDRRSAPRRQLVTVVAEERRQTVDRRRGSERRSTLDRRARVVRRSLNTERPVEHVRNALQLLRNVNAMRELSAGPSEDLTAAIDRLNRAVALLDLHPRS